MHRTHTNTERKLQKNNKKHNTTHNKKSPIQI